MKFDLFGFSITQLSQAISVLAIMFSGKTKSGARAPGMTRYLLFIGHDPIGWRFQILFRSFSKKYEENYIAYMMALRERQNHPHGKPEKTGGVKQAKVVPINTPSGPAYLDTKS